MSEPLPPFEIPVYSSEMLEPATQKAFDEFLAAGHKDADGNTIVGLYMFSMVDARDPEHNEPGHHLGIYAQTPKGDISNCSARELPEPARAAFNAAAGAWVTDDLIQQSIMAHPLKWRDNEYPEHNVGGKLLTYHHFNGLAALTQEYIPTFIQDDGTDPLGPNVAEDFRTSLGSLILPPAISNHEKLNAEDKAKKAYSIFERVWADGCELLEIPLIMPDFTKAKDLHQ